MWDVYLIMIFAQKESRGYWAIENEYGLHYDGVDNSTMSKTYPKYSRVYTGTSAAPVTGGIAVVREPV
jgi:hypothetical protein